MKPKDPIPVKFPEVNFTYTTPESMTKEECGDLPCFRLPGGFQTVSCWKFSLLHRLRFLFTGKMWVFLVMDGHPPMTLLTDSPFPKGGTTKNDGPK